MSKYVNMSYFHFIFSIIRKHVDEYEEECLGSEKTLMISSKMKLLSNLYA